MASSPVANNPAIGRLTGNVNKKDENKVWSEDISATASTEGFWEPDKEFQIKVAVNELKRKFHQSRILKVKYLPTNVTKQEICQMLSDFPIAETNLTSKAGTAGQASVMLEDPEMLEEWDKDRTFMLRGQRIPVCPTLTEMLLCVARLPLDYTEKEFNDFVKYFGEVKYSFLMISEKTGESKGYGFVEYETREKAYLARSKISKFTRHMVKMVSKESNSTTSSNANEGIPLWVEFIDPAITTFEGLHSKCLYVHNLPPDYRDLAGFRHMFSQVFRPPYCQIGIRNGVPLSWGLVEFQSAEEAEATYAKLNGTKIQNMPIKMEYYIPGVRAIHLYMLLLNDTPSPPASSGNGLLPDPPAPTILEAVKNLRKQNPVFALNVENIMVSERLGTAAAEPSISPLPKELDTMGTWTWKKHAKRTPSPRVSTQSPRVSSPSTTPSPSPSPSNTESAARPSKTETKTDAKPSSAPSGYPNISINNGQVHIPLPERPPSPQSGSPLLNQWSYYLQNQVPPQCVLPMASGFWPFPPPSMPTLQAPVQYLPQANAYLPATTTMPSIPGLTHPPVTIIQNISPVDARQYGPVISVDGSNHHTHNPTINRLHSQFAVQAGQLLYKPLNQSQILQGQPESLDKQHFQRLLEQSVAFRQFDPRVPYSRPGEEYPEVPRACNTFNSHPQLDIDLSHIWKDSEQQPELVDDSANPLKGPWTPISPRSLKKRRLESGGSGGGAGPSYRDILTKRQKI